MGLQMIKQRGHIQRVVLQVAIEGRDEVAGGDIEAGLQRRRLTIVANQVDRPEPGPTLGQLLQDAGRGIPRAVIDADEFE